MNQAFVNEVAETNLLTTAHFPKRLNQAFVNEVAETAGEYNWSATACLNQAFVNEVAETMDYQQQAIDFLFEPSLCKRSRRNVARI